MGRNGFVALAAVLALVGCACSGGSSDDSSATTPAPQTGIVTSTQSTTPPVSGTAGPASTTTSSTSTSRPPLPDLVYSIEARRLGQGGDTVLVLLPPGTYSDLDLEAIMLDVIERFAPIATAHAVDTLDTDGDGARNAASAVLELLEREGAFTTGEASFRAEHYFLMLEDGFRVVFQGPFADLSPIILGS